VKSKLLAGASAALLSLSIMSGTPALAQMELQDTVKSQLIALGYLPDDWMISEAQALELQNVVSGADTEDVKRQRIEQIMGDAIAEPASTMTPTERAMAALDDTVRTQLIALGFLPDDWMISEAQALEMQNVLSGGDTEDVKRQRVEQIMGDAIAAPMPTTTPTEQAVAALEESVRTQLIALGFLPADWTISEGQALELQNVVNSTDSDQLKQDRVKQIMGIN
jgi:ethanolamine utilization microcompartment shell protein EutS